MLSIRDEGLFSCFFAGRVVQRMLGTHQDDILNSIERHFLCELVIVCLLEELR